MRIAKVIGTVTLNSCLPSFSGARLRLAVPQSLTKLRGAEEAEVAEVVLWDELGAGEGSFIALSEGPEAAQPFRPAIKPIDAYNAAILDEINIP